VFSVTVATELQAKAADLAEAAAAAAATEEGGAMYEPMSAPDGAGVYGDIDADAAEVRCAFFDRIFHCYWIPRLACSLQLLA
jgi:hypothetical protein